MEALPEPDPQVHHFAHIRVSELIRKLNALDADGCDLPLGWGDPLVEPPKPE